MKTGIALCATIVLLLAGGGCATLRGDKQELTLQTDPAGATITVDGKEKVTSPATVKLKRKAAHQIEVAKDGYRPIVFNFEAQWDGASMTDWALPGGSALMGLSVATGSDRSFNKLDVIKLEKSPDSNPRPLQLYQHRGKLYTKDVYDKVVEEEQKDESRFMGNNS